MYLLDTNILLELLLDQDRADQVEQFMRTIPREKLHISDFSLYSIGVILIRRKLFETFVQFQNDLIIRGGVRLLRLSVQDMKTIASIAQKFNFDFDDAYQYTVAEQYGLTIISFDGDFDRTEKGRRSPAEAVK